MYLCLYVRPKSLHSLLYSHSVDSEVGDASRLRIQSSLNFTYTTVSYVLFPSPFHPPTAGDKGILKNCQGSILSQFSLNCLLMELRLILFYYWHLATAIPFYCHYSYISQTP